MDKHILMSDGTFYTISDELQHHGIKGMKWGVRRYQNNDGTYTAAGKKRRNSESDRTASSKEPTTYDEASAAKKAKIKKAVKIGAAVAGTALAAYGTYKVSKFVGNKLQTKAYNKAFDAAKAVKGSYLLDQAKRLERDTHDWRVGVEDFRRRLDNVNNDRAALRNAETEYAKQATKNAAAVIKTLLNKNGNISIEDLMFIGW